MRTLLMEMAENKDNSKAQSKETGTMNVHLFNCDRTYKLQAIRALLEDVEKESRWQFAVQEHYFPLPQMAKTCAKIPDLKMDFAVFVVHAKESWLSLNEESSGIGYAKIYRALLQATNDRVLIVIGGDDNYKDEQISQVLSRWAKMKILSQFSNEYLDGRKSFIFSWEKKHRHIHKEALLHFLDDTKRGEVFVPLELKKGVNVLSDTQTPQGKSTQVQAPPVYSTITATHHAPAQLQSHAPPATKSSHSKNRQHRSHLSSATHEIRQGPLGQKEERKEEAQLTPVNVAIIECGVSRNSVKVAHCFFNKIAKQLRLKPHLVPIQGTSPRQLLQNLLKNPHVNSFGYVVLLVDKAEFTKIATRKNETLSYKDLLEKTQVNAETQAILIVCNDTDLIQGQLISENATNFLTQVKGAEIEINEDRWITLSWNEEDPSFSTEEYELHLVELLQIADARREIAPQPLRTKNQASAQNHHSETRKQPGNAQGSLYPSRSGTPMMGHNAAHASSSNLGYNGSLLLWEGTLEYGVPRTSYKCPGWEPPQSLRERLRKDNQNKSYAEFKVKQNADGSHSICVDSKVWGALKAVFKRASSTDYSNEIYYY